MFQLSPHKPSHLICDLLRSVEQMLVIQMGITGGRLVVGMAGQSPDHGQGFLAHCGRAGEAMAQVVYLQFAKIGPFKDHPPEALDAADRPSILVVPEQPWDFGMARQTVDDLACRRAEPSQTVRGPVLLSRRSSRLRFTSCHWRVRVSR